MYETITKEKEQQLFQINQQVNNDMKYVTDLEQYDKLEYWPNIPGKKGDCEDYARAKELELRKLGWNSESMGRATCFPNWSDGKMHCVLLVNTDKGTYVLDLHSDEPMPWDDADIDKWVLVPDYLKNS